ALIRDRSITFGDFTWLKFSSHNLQSPVLKEQKLFSPDGIAFAQGHYTRRANRILIEGTSSSIRKRSRFPLHPSPPAMSGVFIEVLDERFVISFCIGPGGSGLRKVSRRRP